MDQIINQHIIQLNQVIIKKKIEIRCNFNTIFEFITQIEIQNITFQFLK